MKTVSPLLDARRSQLVLIDLQTRLAGAMNGGDRDRVLRNSAILSRAADLLRLPILVSEQYPKGLGPTEPTVADLLPPQTPVIDKTCFACSASEDFLVQLAAAARPQLILCGMESHVCVLQTALTLQGEYQVFVVEDAVCSRSMANHDNALARLRQNGVTVTNTESVLFEWLRDASHEHFKAVSALIR